MDAAAFNKLLQLITPKIAQQNTVLRQCISAEDRRTLETLVQQGGNRTARTPQEIRLEFQEYFNSSGAVPWQQQCYKLYYVI
ncbi:hypothetical protein MML48_2g00006940 [Holotrichia oblita]|uniref:Uncharacterized protein n=1 Tax=Holotrichia oblita TaxID=644536 RepID=A0ACB9TJA9_HOLOL|nr:hypothetical protein MML48_2g00006940 [Holotrichia oblita]